MPGSFSATSWRETVVTKPGSRLVPENLDAHCRARIAGYKVPRSYEVRDQPLPKSGAGKILKRQLREPFWAGHAHRVA